MLDAIPSHHISTDMRIPYLQLNNYHIIGVSSKINNTLLAVLLINTSFLKINQKYSTLKSSWFVRNSLDSST